MYFPISLQCNYLYKVWQNVENFPHVVFFATSRGKFFYLAREIIFANFAFFSIFWFFDVEKSLQGLKMVKQKSVMPVGTQRAASAKAKSITQNT